VLNSVAHDFIVMTAHLFAGIVATAHPFALGALYQLLDRQQVLLQSHIMHPKLIPSGNNLVDLLTTLVWTMKKSVKLHIESFNETNCVCINKQKLKDRFPNAS
jgi:hypothetical protein